MDVNKIKLYTSMFFQKRIIDLEMKSLLWINDKGNKLPLTKERKEKRIKSLAQRLGDDFYIIQSPKFLKKDTRDRHISITKAKTINTTDKRAFGREATTIDLENQIVSFSNFSQLEHIEFQNHYALTLLRVCRLLAAANCLKKMLTNTDNIDNAWVNESIKDIKKSPYIRYELAQYTSIVFKACFNFNHAVEISRGKHNIVSDLIIITNDWQLKSDLHGTCRLKYCQEAHFLNQLGTSTLIIDVKLQVAFFLGQDETINLFNLLSNPFFDTFFESESDATEYKKVLQAVATRYKSFNRNLPAIIKQAIVYRVLTKKELQESHQAAFSSAQEPMCTPAQAQRNVEQQTGITIFNEAGAPYIPKIDFIKKDDYVYSPELSTIEEESEVSTFSATTSHSTLDNTSDEEKEPSHKVKTPHSGRSVHNSEIESATTSSSSSLLATDTDDSQKKRTTPDNNVSEHNSESENSATSSKSSLPTPDTDDSQKKRTTPDNNVSEHNSESENSATSSKPSLPTPDTDDSQDKRKTRDSNPSEHNSERKSSATSPNSSLLTPGTDDNQDKRTTPDSTPSQYSSESESLTQSTSTNHSKKDEPDYEDEEGIKFVLAQSDQLYMSQTKKRHVITPQPRKPAQSNQLYNSQTEITLQSSKPTQSDQLYKSQTEKRHVITPQPRKPTQSDQLHKSQTEITLQSSKPTQSDQLYKSQTEITLQPRKVHKSPKNKRQDHTKPEYTSTSDDDSGSDTNSSKVSSETEQGYERRSEIKEHLFQDYRKVYRLSEKKTPHDQDYEYVEFEHLGIYFKLPKRNTQGPIFEYLVREKKTKKQRPSRFVNRFFEKIPLFNSESSSDEFADYINMRKVSDVESSDESTNSNTATQVMITEVKNATQLDNQPKFADLKQIQNTETASLSSSSGGLGDTTNTTNIQKLLSPQNNDTPRVLHSTVLTEFHRSRVIYRNHTVKSIARKKQPLRIYEQSKFDLNNITQLEEPMRKEWDTSKSLGLHPINQLTCSNSIKYEDAFTTNITDDSVETWPDSDNTLRYALKNHANIGEKIDAINFELRKYGLQIIPTQYGHQNILHATSPTGALTTTAVEVLHNAFIDEYQNFCKLSKMISDHIQIPDDNDYSTLPLHTVYIELIKVNWYRDNKQASDEFHPSDILQILQDQAKLESLPQRTDGKWIKDWGLKKLTLIARILCKHIVVFTLPDEGYLYNYPFTIDYIEPSGLWLFNIEKDDLKILSCIRKLQVEPGRILFIFYYKNKKTLDLNGRFFAIDRIDRPE